MRFAGASVSAVLSVCLLMPNSVDVLAADAKRPTVKSPKKARGEPVPARPTGVPRQVSSKNATDDGYKRDTITESENELGQTVYSVSASHFDISPPLRDMAAAATPQAPAGEDESPSNPQLPVWRVIRSDVPDPVVQPAIQPADTLAPGHEPLAAPTMGFNFLGVGFSVGSPSDCNGSVGGNQFVETVNISYQVWSLDRVAQTATSVLGPVSINTLWAGFGGPCQSQNSGDPIVLYDKTAKRWLISQFTSGADGNGDYYQCAAVSTTSDATGPYARYAFVVPSGKFGDYPHFGVWPPGAYFMMAHGFNGRFVAIFAAMNRTKMLAADETATWLVIQDPSEGGHMPADLDGFALPPTSAPGIFVSLHNNGMYIYRMKVAFASGTATKTLQAIVPIAPANAACFGGTCIPQPGTANLLDAISDRLMFRAAYRNYIDHESLVVSHSVNPSVPGVVSGVRWYDIRLSGNPDATCPSYPCTYQQGTIADVSGGRSRWMPSLAMDGAENILVGYSTTGKTDGVENHTLRYTGRAKGDPLGTMTVPETTIATGTANNVGNSRWGDYHSMSIDPFDDCTFWYVGQYYTAQNAWSTRIASATFPSGSGAGECAASACINRPGSLPAAGTVTALGNNQLLVTWTAPVPAVGGYAIERADGACGSEGLYRPLAAADGSATSFTDTNVLGGFKYSYRVRTASDATGRCQAQLANICKSGTATGNCNLKPSFAGAVSAAGSQQGNCGVTISWTPGASRCPLTPSVRYNIFRGTVPNFVPSVANRIAACVVGPSSYLDTDNLQSGTTYYYVVRAEDSSTDNGGECGGGNEESNGATVAAMPFACVPNTCPGQADGTSCDDGDGCSTDDACASGACVGTPPATPPETQNLQAAADKQSYNWDLVPDAPRYDVTRGVLSGLPVGPGGGDEVCFDDLADPLLVDPITPFPNSGFWYVSRAETACSSGSFGLQSNGSPRTTGTCP